VSDPIQDLIAQAARTPSRASGAMVASLRLEAIGDNYRRLKPAGIDHFFHVMGRIPRAHYARILSGTSPWVARLVSRHPRRGFDREFLRGNRDYLEANGCGSRGIYIYYLLPEGVYEVHELVNWSKNWRYFVRSVAGKIVEIDGDEVDRWLSA
jgi:hypothetical protein